MIHDVLILTGVLKPKKKDMIIMLSVEWGDF